MAKTAAERQADARQRRKEAGMVFAQLVIPSKDYTAIKRAATSAGVDLKQWMHKALMRAAKQNRPGG